MHLLKIDAAPHDDEDLDGVEGEAGRKCLEPQRHPEEGLALTALGGSKAWHVVIIRCGTGGCIIIDGSAVVGWWGTRCRIVFGWQGRDF